jgi:hypothetical protein
MNVKRFRFPRKIYYSILLVFALCFVSSFLQEVAGAAYTSLVMQSSTTVTSPPVLLQTGTAGSSTIYANSTSAKVSTVAPAPTPSYYPSSYNVATGTYVSGTVPASVQTVDSNYFIVRSTPSATSTTPYNPSGYSLLGSTTLLSGSTSDLASDNSVYMSFRSYGTATSAMPYNPSSYALVENTTLVSGTLSDLQSNNAVYMTFRSYVSATSSTSKTDAFIAYRSNTGTNTINSPKNRAWDGDTAAWGGENEMATAGSPVRWVRTVVCPKTQRALEKIIATLSADGYLDAYVFDGTSWTVTNNIASVWTTDPGTSIRPYDIAYETSSGRALVVYDLNLADSTKDLGYKIWTFGTGWSQEYYIDFTGVASTNPAMSFIRLASNPDSASNQIAMVFNDGTNADAFAAIWSGSAWTKMTTLTTTNTIATRESIGIQYSSYYKKILAIAGNSADSMAWKTYAQGDADWTAQTAFDPDPDSGNNVCFGTLKRDPAATSTDDYIMYAGINDLSDLNAFAFDMADTPPSRLNIVNEVDDSIESPTSRPIDFDWEPTGNKGLIVWGRQVNYIHYNTYSISAGWGASWTTSVSYSENQHPWVQLEANPRNIAGDTKILGVILGTSGSSYKLGAIRWDGTTLTVIGTSTFTADTNKMDYKCFDLKYQLFGDPTEFTSQAEFTGTSSTYTWTQLEWTIDSSFTTTSVTATFQLYNYQTGQYPTSGDGYITDTIGTTDTLKSQTITTNPSNFRDLSGNWKLKAKGVKSTATQLDWKSDWIEFKPTYYSECTSEVEFTGTSNTANWAQLVWTVDSSLTTGSVTIIIQVYNFTLGGYPASGNGYDSYTSSATAYTDETRTKTITTNPANFRDASGNWKIKVKGVKTTATQFDFKADWVEYKPSYYSEYTVSTEFLFSSMTTNTPSQLNFTVVSEYDIASVSVTIQVWNYSSSAYVTSGEGYQTYSSSGVNETKLLSINTNLQWYTSSGNAKIKLTGILATTTQYQQKANQIKLAYSYSSSSNYNYVLKIVNQVSDAWKIRLKAYSQSNIGRLTNCTIYFRSSSDGTSRQVYIKDGVYVNQTGSWYDLPASPAERYIVVALQATNSEVSHVYVYLEILVPDKTTYAQYVITFEIT